MDKMEHIVKVLPIHVLEPDPINREGFNIKDLDELTEYIQEEGFFGDVTAYPIENGKYRLESGERRYWAAQKAGLTEIPVNITAPPSSEIERRTRLERRNLGNRRMDPMDMAKLVSFEYDTNYMKKHEGKLQASLVEETARKLHISTSQVSKYKMLMDLTPELQTLVSSKKVPWAIMAQASQLPEANQIALAGRIEREMKLNEITGTWLAREIREYRHVRLNGSVSDKDRYVHSSKALKKRIRRKDGMKAIEKIASLSSNIILDEYLIKEGDKKYALEQLQLISAKIESLIADLKSELNG